MHRKISIQIKAASLMEAVVAMAITTIVMWLSFSALQYRFLPINPERKLDAVLLADSLLNTICLSPSDTLELKIRNFRVEAHTEPYKESNSKTFLLTLKIYATSKYIIVTRQKILIHENEP